jgi:hypothetical protein
VLPVPGTTLRLEVWGGARKADLLETLLDREVEVVGPEGEDGEEADGRDAADSQDVRADGARDGAAERAAAAAD